MTRARRGSVPLPSIVAALLALALLASVVACGTSAASVAPVPSGLTSPVEGVPIDIDAEGFSKVTAFVIRTAEGEQLRFAMGRLENAVDFPPNHLAEHLAASTRIRVFFRDENGVPTAYRLEDVETP
ncbi:MAG TPA: hypothetical protein VFY23_11980 [Candidatus Limnocylindrales bacterium]|nr:hypothetical protein [Candidatus Limnocylindrales bacterium]